MRVIGSMEFSKIPQPGTLGEYIKGYRWVQTKS